VVVDCLRLYEKRMVAGLHRALLNVVLFFPDRLRDQQFVQVTLDLKIIRTKDDKYEDIAVYRDFREGPGQSTKRVLYADETLYFGPADVCLKTLSYDFTDGYDIKLVLELAKSEPPQAPFSKEELHVHIKPDIATMNHKVIFDEESLQEAHNKIYDIKQLSDSESS
jgi:hypothetical protein